MQRNFSKRDILISSGLILIGIFVGWLIFGSSGTDGAQQAEVSASTQQEKATIWTCSMHPQIQRNEPGKCPICAMDLIPKSEANDQSGGSVSEYELELSESAVQLANIQTTLVKRKVPHKTVYLPGKIAIDERRISSISARFSGRIEHLSINFTGQTVKKGQVLGRIYSPALITAQKELLEAAQYKENNPALYRSARQKLKHWDMTEKQINEFEESGQIQEEVAIVAPKTGVVTKRLVEEGSYVKEGTELFQVADLKRVWVLLEAYESDIGAINVGDLVRFSVKAYPGQTFKGTITYIDPMLDPQSRTVDVRAEIVNPGYQLKPGMLVEGRVSAQLDKEPRLLVPRSAVLWTGKRSVVYVQTDTLPSPTFRYKKIVLGDRTGDYYIVKKGLEAGQRVVTNGVFKLDAAAQLRGKASMMSAKADKQKDQQTLDTSMTAQEGVKQTSFKVYGNCEMCKKRIEEALQEKTGVKQAIWDVDRKMLETIYIPETVTVNELHQKVAAVGHDTKKVKADSTVYSELPDCCQYPREPGQEN